MTPPAPSSDPSHGATPAVSVVMAVHNGLPYLESALRSIMDQSLRDIEIIVVDDASSDDTPAVLARLAEEDPRIRVLTNTENLRLAASLNRGLDIARAPLIARMDADDIAHPDRLSVQKAYMDAHPDVVLSSTSIRKTDAQGAGFASDIRAYDDARVRWIAALSMPLYHPGYMFRAVPGGSPLRYGDDPIAQDYALCTAALARGQVVSLGEVLLDYRVHGSSITLTKRQRQDAVGRRIAEAFQASALPDDLCRSLVPVMDGFYALDRPLETAAVARGLRRHVAHGKAHDKAFTRWKKGYAVMVMVYLMRQRRASTPAVMAALFRHLPDFLPAAYAFRNARRRLKTAP